MELPRDAEAVAGDEDAIEDDRCAGRIEGDALGLERGRPDRAPELARLAPSETHRGDRLVRAPDDDPEDRKSTRLNSSHTVISYAVFCLKKKTAMDGAFS